MNNYDVSIIVPVYNVENFIEKCATTLFEQDYDNIEYIFVNDCTPDNSVKVLEETIQRYPDRKDDIKIIHNETNQGSSITRKNGLDKANGEYILFIDSDDWVELDMVSSLIKKAKESGADIVCCDYFLNFKDREIYNKLAFVYEKDIIFKRLLSGGFSPSLCDKIYKKDLFFNANFPQFSYAEDYFINIQIFTFAKKISYSNNSFYHYNQTNDVSIVTSQKLSARRSEIKKLFIKANEFLEKNNLLEYRIYLYQYILILIITNSERQTKKNIYDVSPRLYKIEYLWKNNNLPFFRKVVFSLGFLDLGFIVARCKKIYKFMQGKR